LYVAIKRVANLALSIDDNDIEMTLHETLIYKHQVMNIMRSYCNDHAKNRHEKLSVHKKLQNKPAQEAAPI
jgi:hypothetical protein